MSCSTSSKRIFSNTFVLALVSLLLISGKGACNSQPATIPKPLPKVRSLKVAGNINRSHFKLMKDSKSAKHLASNFVWHLSSFKDQAEFLKMTSTLRRINPVIVLGSYASACTTLPASEDIFPPTKVPLEQCKPEWFLRDKDNNLIIWGEQERRYWLDMRRQDVRKAVITLAIERCKYNGLDAVCFDNCYWGLPNKKAPVSKQEWTAAFMKFFEEAGKAAHREGLKCVVNVATHVRDIPGAFVAIAPYVDGIMTEMAFHPQARTPEMLHRELKAYESVLKQDKIVLVLTRQEDEQFGLLAIWPLASKYGKIFLSARGGTRGRHEPLYDLVNV